MHTSFNSSILHSTNTLIHSGFIFYFLIRRWKDFLAGHRACYIILLFTHDLGFVSAVLLFILWHSEDLTNNTDVCYFLHTRRRCSSTTYTLDYVYAMGKERVSRELVKERKRLKTKWVDHVVVLCQ